MRVTVSKTISFIPEFNGNRSLPATDQIVVKLKNPTIAIKERCRDQSETTARADPQGRIDHIDIQLRTDENTILREMVDSISGCEYDDGEKTAAITNAKTLNEAPVDFSPLREEIVKKCKEILEKSEVNEKNSE